MTINDIPKRFHCCHTWEQARCQECHEPLNSDHSNFYSKCVPKSARFYVRFDANQNLLTFACPKCGESHGNCDHLSIYHPEIKPLVTLTIMTQQEALELRNRATHPTPEDWAWLTR